MTCDVATIFRFLGSGWLTCIRPLRAHRQFKLVLVDHFGTMPISTGTGYSIPKQPQPYHGYYFKVLKGQFPLRCGLAERERESGINKTYS